MSMMASELPVIKPRLHSGKDRKTTERRRNKGNDMRTPHMLSSVIDIHVRMYLYTDERMTLALTDETATPQ